MIYLVLNTIIPWHTPPYTHTHEHTLHTYVWCQSVYGEPSTQASVHTHTRTHQYRETGVYRHTFLSLSIAFVGNTHLKIVTSLAVDLKRRLLPTPFPTFCPFLAVPHVPMCAYSWIDNEPKLKRTRRCFYRLPLVAMSKIKVMTSTRERDRE